MRRAAWRDPAWIAFGKGLRRWHKLRVAQRCHVNMVQLPKKHLRSNPLVQLARW